MTRTTGADRADYSYTPGHRLATAVVTEAGVTRSSSYRYAGDGFRVAAVADGVETRYLVDDNRPYSEVIDEYTPAGASAAHFVADDAVISVRRGGATVVLHAAAVGSVRLATTNGGETAASATDSFGRVTESTGDAAVLPGFAGRARDGVAGLVDLRARDYDPRAGRFRGRDPFPADAARPGTANRYAFAGDNAVNFTDPSGMFTLAEQLVSTGTASELMKSYTQNLAKLFLATVRINACVIKPGNQLRTMGARLIEDGVPRGEVMYDHGTQLIAAGLKSIEAAIKKAYQDIGNDILSGLKTKWSGIGKPPPKSNANTWLDDIQNYYKKQRDGFLKKDLKGKIDAGEKFATGLGEFYNKLETLLFSDDLCEKSKLLEEFGNALIKKIPKP